MPNRTDARRAGRSIPFPTPFLTTTLLAALAMGCSGGDAASDSPSRATVRDSAGIEIVENAIPDASPIAIAAADEPLLSIGTIEGNETSQFHRVQDGIRLPDGRLAILNAGTYEVRIYGPDGTLETRFGHQGEGPGEFGLPMQLTLLPPDTLAVFDLRSWEVLFFLDDGTFLGSEPGRSAYQDLVPEGLLAEGGFAAPHEGLFLRAYRFGVQHPVGERFVPEMHLIFVARDSTTRELYEPGGFEQVMLKPEAGRPTSAQVRFGMSGVAALGGRPPRVWTGRNDRYELWQFDSGGELLRIVRADRRPLAVTEADVERSTKQVRQSLTDAPIPEDRKKAMLDMALQAPSADSMPVFRRVFVTVDGGAWVGRVQRPSEDPDDWIPEYDVFGPDGRWLGLAHPPKGVQPLEIGADYFLGLRRDDLGVEHVELYDLGPPSVAR